MALLLPNTPQFVTAFNGVLAAGATAVPINPLNSPEEIHRELEETEAEVLICLDRLRDKAPSGPWKTLMARASAYAPMHLQVLDGLRQFRGNLGKAESLEDMITISEKAQLLEVNAKEDIAAILYTSGTTGKPKGVMLTHYNLVVNALQSYFWLRGWGYSLKPQPLGWPIILCAVPFFHSYGLNILNEAVQFGCTLLLVPRPEPEAIMRDVHLYKATHLPLIPRFVQEILDHPKLKWYNLTSAVACNTGGAPIREDLMKRFMELTKAPFYQGYGLTEAGPVTHASPVEGERNLSSTGLAYPDTEAEIVDLQLGEVEMPPGEPGELIIRGPQVMKGYWKSPEETGKAIREGWLYTGDIARVDERGWLYIIGRKRERIIADGHSVYPNEVEDVLLSHPDVENAIAVGTPDPLRCDTDIQAFVVLHKGAEQKNVEDSLLRLCRERLEAYKVPSKIEIVPKLPLTPMGKVDRLAVEAEIERRIQLQMDEYAKKQRS